MEKEFKKALKFVLENKTWTEEQETRALNQIDRMRCPLRMTQDGGFIEDEICDLMEEYSQENNLADDWWSDHSAEDIFWEIGDL